MKKLLARLVAMTMLLCLLTSSSSIRAEYTTYIPPVPVIATTGELVQVFRKADWQAIWQDARRSLHEMNVPAFIASAKAKMEAINWRGLVDEAIRSVQETDWSAVLQSGKDWLDQTGQKLAPIAVDLGETVSDALDDATEWLDQVDLPNEIQDWMKSFGF